MIRGRERGSSLTAAGRGRLESARAADDRQGSGAAAAGDAARPRTRPREHGRSSPGRAALGSVAARGSARDRGYGQPHLSAASTWPLPFAVYSSMPQSAK